MTEAAKKPLNMDQVNPDAYKPYIVPQAIMAITGRKQTETEVGNLSGRRNGLDAASAYITDKRRVNLPVGPELKDAADWYTHVFKFPGYTQMDEDSIVLHLPVGIQNLVLWKTEQRTNGLRMSLNGKHQPVFMLNVKDVDSIHERIVANGGESLLAPCDLFFRIAMIKDPYGNELGMLQEPFGWSKKIGRNGDASTLDWVKIPVPGTIENLLSTAEWYRTYLGFQVGKLTEENDGIDLQPGNLHLQLIDTGAPAYFKAGGHTIPLVVLETPNIEAIYKKMIDTDASVGFIDMIEVSGKSFIFFDPNGNAIGLIQM